MRRGAVPTVAVGYKKVEPEVCLLPGDEIVLLCAGIPPEAAATLMPNTAWSTRVFLTLDLNTPDADLAALCRTAGEVWVLDGAPAEDEQTSRVLSYRLSSIPPCDGEQRSLLHAPELGLVRYLRQNQAGEWVCLPQQDRWVASTRPTVDHDYEAVVFRRRVRGADAALPVRILELDRVARNGVALATEWARVAKRAASEADRGEHLMRMVFALFLTLTAATGVGLQLLSVVEARLPMAAVYAIFFMFVGFAYAWAKGLRWNSRRMAYRLVTQAIEVQLQLGRAGLREHIISHFHLRQASGLHWLKSLLRPMYLLRADESPVSSQTVLQQWLPSLLQRESLLLRRCLVRDQLLSRSVWGCYLVSAALTLFLMLSPALAESLAWLWGSALGISSTIGTLLLILRGTLGHAGDSHLHQHFCNVIRHAQALLVEPLPEHEYDELLLDIGRECLNAAADHAVKA